MLEPLSLEPRKEWMKHLTAAIGGIFEYLVVGSSDVLWWEIRQCQYAGHCPLYVVIVPQDVFQVEDFELPVNCLPENNQK